MTAQEAEKVLSLVTQFNKIELENYLNDIVLRDAMTKIQPTPQDVIIEQLKVSIRMQEHLFYKIAQLHLSEVAHGITYNKFIDEIEKCNAQFAEHNAIRNKKLPPKSRA